MFLIVPNYVRDEINRRIDAALVEMPEAAKDREHFYGALLGHFEVNGVIPDFSIRKNEAAQCASATASVATPSIDAADIEGSPQ